MASASALDAKSLVLPDPLPLDSGQRLETVRVAYETYGELAGDKSNAILIFHALSGDQHVGSERSGVTFDPSGSRRYCASQRGFGQDGAPGPGAIYEVSGPFHGASRAVHAT